MKDHLENRIKEINTGLTYETSLLASLEKQVADTVKKIAGLSIDLAVFNNALATEEVNQKVGFWHHTNQAKPISKDKLHDEGEVPQDTLTAEFAKMLDNNLSKNDDMPLAHLDFKPLNLVVQGGKVVVKDAPLNTETLTQVSKELDSLSKAISAQNKKTKAAKAKKLTDFTGNKSSQKSSKINKKK